MNALVTGGSGYLGRVLVHQLLQAGHRVRSVDLVAWSSPVPTGLEPVQADLSQETDVAGFDCVFHVAARARLGGTWAQFFAANVESTARLLAACRRQGVPRFVYTSSPSACFRGRPIRDGDTSLPYPAHPLSHYCGTKALAEQMVLSADSPELATVALRPHLIWGPGEPHLLPPAEQGLLPQVGDGRNRVDIAYVDNVADAHVVACERLASIHGRAFYLSQGEPVVLWDWVRDLLRRLDLPPIRRRIPFGVAWTLGAACEALPWKGEPPMTRYLAAQMAVDHFCRLDPDLGYRPRVSTEEGMERWVQALREERAKRGPR